ncbi:hypothetical protein PSV08DRAFT_385628 [Bipolaris maydis]|uniref:uncharacterized protein n=1 Tax=Cochliobolus heterostrophus TaxID=5016 RepID=UPI0024D5759D|nr:hypothetical protein PSV08DRAFT_385628 [Bipolaris maydis]KAJ6284433.1 hypothetical protein J3E71DRAFT_375426 [Bipolaris maydis]
MTQAGKRIPNHPSSAPHGFLLSPHHPLQPTDCQWPVLMQDDQRPIGSALTGPYPVQFKVAIPRLSSRRALPTTTSKSRPRDRVQLACRNCHKRSGSWHLHPSPPANQTFPEIKCSGGLPRCNHCDKTDKPCVYERPRRDRLALANARNDALVSILKDLSLRLEGDDRQRVIDALQNSDDESTPPAFTPSSSSQLSVASLYQKQEHSHLQPTTTSSSTQVLGSSIDCNQSSLPRLDGILPDESDDEGEEAVADLFDVVEVGFPSQVSEVQWLQSLRNRVQVVGPLGLEPTSASVPMAFQTPPAPISSSAFTTASQVPSYIAPITYYMDDEGDKIIHGGNPFELPSEQIASFLFHYFKRTVQKSFPILPAMLEAQLHQYYSLSYSHKEVHYPQNWFALVNLVFAIGAKFSHLIQNDWRAATLDHVTYISRAYQLFAMNDSAFGFSTPDLSSTQAAGLFSIYYMSVGHFNRAWMMARRAMQSALSLGLHVQQEDLSMSAARQQSRIDTWWSLHALESLLGSITGRPNTLPGDEITTPSSKTFFDTISSAYGQGAPKITNMAFLDADSSLHMLTQQVIYSLYTQRKLVPPWSRVQQTMVALVGDLDKWVVDCVPHLHSENSAMDYNQQRDNSLLKFQYYRVKILMTRPSLRRIERSTESGSGEFTSLDQSMAEACIQAASDVVALLGTVPDIATLYEKGPWWTIVHNVMQALAILMNAIACPDHFADSYSVSAHGVRQLVGWLLAMRATNVIAARAHQLVYSLVKTSNPQVWESIADVFPDDVSMVLLQPSPVLVDPKYVPWPAKESPIDALFEYDLNDFFVYNHPTST